MLAFVCQEPCCRQLPPSSVQNPVMQVAETAPEAVAEDKDSINGVQQLSHEATAINQTFSQQVSAACLLLPVVLTASAASGVSLALLGPLPGAQQRRWLPAMFCRKSLRLCRDAQVLSADGAPHECGDPNPFAGQELPEGRSAASVAYRSHFHMLLAFPLSTSIVELL